MKKFVKGSLAIVGLMSLGITTASAKTMTAADIDKLTASEFGGTTIYDTAYVFGKHVYVNMFTMADSVSAANTLEGATDAKLYYKDGDNVWKNAITNEVVDKANLKVEMTKLVGTKNGNHVSDSNIYNEENGYIVTEDYLDGRVAEVFTDEQASTKITKVEIIGDTNLGTDLKTDSNKYNSSHTTVAYNNSRVTLTANAPLLTYTYDYTVSGSTTNISGKIIGLKVRFNKEVDMENNGLTNTFTSGTYRITLDDTKTVATIWADAKSLNGKTITVTDKDDSSEKQTVTLEFKEPKKAANVMSDKTYTVETEGVSATQVKIIDKVYTIFYTDKTISTAVVRENGDKQMVTFEADSNINLATESTITEMIEVKAPVKADLKEVKAGAADAATNEAYNYRQNSISNITMTQGKGNNEYDITLTQCGILNANDTVELVMDLGVDSGLSGGNSSSKVAGKTTFNEAIAYKLDSNNKPIKQTIQYTASGETYTFNFTFEDAIPEFKLSSVKIANKDGKVHVATGNDVLNQAQNNENNAFRDNTEMVEFSKFDSESNTAYIQATNNAFVALNGSKIYGLVVDFGIDPEDITVPSGVKVIKTRLSDFGASGTQFVVLADASNATSSITFTNAKTHKTYTLNINLAMVEFFKIAETDLNAVIVDPVDKVKIVKLVKNDGTTEDNFRVNTDVKYFRATVDGVEKTFTIKDDRSGYDTPQNSIIIKSVEKTTDNTRTSEFNQNSVNSVSFDGVTNTINVKLDATLDNSVGYNVVVDLGSDKVAEKSNILTNIKDKDGNKTTKYLLTVTDSKNTSNGIIDDGQEMIVDTTPNKIIVKTTYVKNNAKTYLSLNNAKEISLTGNNIPDAVKANNNGVKATVGNINDVTTENKDVNGVILTIDRPVKNISKQVTDYTINGLNVVGLLVDFGTRDVAVPTKDVSGTATPVTDIVTITTDNDLLSKYGATGTQVIVWLKMDAFKDTTNNNKNINKSIKVTLKNTNNTNKNQTLDAYFEVKEDIANLEVKSVNVASAKANDIVSTSENYIKVQNNYTTKYETVSGSNNKVTITGIKNKSTVSDNYTVSSTTSSGVTTSSNAKWYGLIVDLGVNPDNLEMSVSSGNSGAIYDNNNAHAKALGATSNTAIVVWVKADNIEAIIPDTNGATVDNGSLLFTNNYNDETVTLDLVLVKSEN